MEHLEYLIRILTYKRSILELKLKNHSLTTAKQLAESLELKGKIDGLNESITEIYKLVSE